jgi:hypothetical protein
MSLQTNNNQGGPDAQNHDEGVEPQGPPLKKEGREGRLPLQQEKPQAPAAKPPKQADWRPIDLSHGIFRDKELIGSRRSFGAHLRKDLKKDLGSMLNASQRREVSDELAGIRSRGLRRGEVRKTLGRLVEQGSLSKFEAKKLRREFKATKGSSGF